MSLEKTTRKVILSGLFATIFLDLVGFGMFIPLLPNVARELGGSPTQAALLSTLFSLGTLMSSFFLGWLSDRAGRRPVLLLTIALSALVQGLTGWVPSLMMLMVLRFVAGAAAGNISVAQACISDITPPKERGKTLVLIGLAFGGGFAVGPALGSLVARLAPPALVLPAVSLVSLVLNLLNLLFVSRYLTETHVKFRDFKINEADQSEVFRQTQTFFIRGGKKLWITIMVVQFLQVFGFVGLETLLPLLLSENYGLAPAQVYDGFLTLGLLVLFANGFVSRRVLGFLGDWKTLNVGQLLLAAGMCLMVFGIPHTPWVFGALALVAFGTACSNPALGALVSHIAPPQKQGSAFGVAQTVAAVARILGPVSLGGLYEAQGPNSLLVSVAILLVGCTMTMWAFGGWRQRRPEHLKGV